MNDLESAINSYLTGDVNSAIRLLKSYLEANPNPPSGQAHYYLGLAYTDIGKDSEAGEYFSRALEIEPEKGIFHYQLAQVYSKLMLFSQAIPHLIKTIEQNPEHVRARFILGSIYFKNGELDMAEEQFEAVTRISPSYADGFYELGNCLYYKGDEENAKAAFIKAVELNNDLIAPHYKLGRIYSDEKAYDKAIEHLSKAYTLGMDDPAFLSHYVLTLAANGEMGKAQKLIKIIEDSNPAMPELIKLKEAACSYEHDISKKQS